MGKPFAGFKAQLVADLGETHIETEVRYAKIEVPEDYEAKIITRDDSGNTVRFTTLADGKVAQITKGYIRTDTNEIVPKENVHSFQVVDGEEREVFPFERAKKLEVLKTIPTEKVKEFCIENEYELWADETAGLYKLAKILHEKDQVAVTKISFGGFKEYIAFLQPLLINGSKFTINMSLTRFKKTQELKHVMEYGPGMEKLQAKNNSNGPKVKLATVEV